jgi:hypothetical protein
MNWTDTEQLAVLIAAACLLGAVAVGVVYRIKMTPAERERRRRLKLNELGRMGDGMITDVQDDTLYFTYSVSGVSYNASQDVSRLRQLLPGELSHVIGPVWMKYLVRNPANSIVVCEHWSGIRNRAEAARQEPAVAEAPGGVPASAGEP